MTSKDVPPAAAQAVAYKWATREAINQLKANLEAPRLPPQAVVDEDMYPRSHLLRSDQGWEPPAKEVVVAYFQHFQQHFPGYGTNERLAGLLGVSSDRRVREYKQGVTKLPYHVWRRFLVMTGRVPPEVPQVFAFMGEVDGQREMPL